MDEPGSARVTTPTAGTDTQRQTLRALRPMEERPAHARASGGVDPDRHAAADGALDTATQDVHEVRPRAASARATILVVDDDDAIRTLVSELLADEGYEVLGAPDGKQALEILDRRSPDLILLDMRMPVMDGWAFSAAYRERTALRAPIIVITAATDARRTAREVEAAGYLGKPFDLDDLLAVVERALAAPE